MAKVLYFVYDSNYKLLMFSPPLMSPMKALVDILFHLLNTTLMNSTKLLLGTLAGFIGYFLSGFVLYTIVFEKALASSMPNMASVQAVEPNMVALVFGNLAGGFLLAWIFEKWAGIRTLGTGAINGAVIGALITLSYDSMILGTTNLMTWSGIFLDALIYAIASAVAGALVGLTLGYKRK